MTVPDTGFNINGLGVEATVFFDGFARAGRMKEARGGGRPGGRIIPAVEYLQSQRVRMMMMMKLAEATSMVDVYVVAPNNTAPGDAGGPAIPSETPPARPPSEPPTPQTAGQRHFNMANLACYPAINIPNGFNEKGNPTNVTFFARPFGEMELLALAKKYQDAAGFLSARPTALDT